MMRPSGRDFPLQPHFGVNRIASWSPSTGTTINPEDLPIASVGTVSTPTLVATNLATSMRRWRLTSAVTADAAADQRGSGWVNCIGFQRGTHTRWQIIHNDDSGSPTLINMSTAFALATNPIMTLTIAAAPNGASCWVRAVDEATGTVFERELSTLLPASTQFLSPRLYMNNGATAAAVAFDCSGVYVETDY